MFRFNRAHTRRSKAGTRLLQDAVLDWRAAETAGEALAQPTRERILSAVRPGSPRAPERAVGSLFFPAGRLALAGALPVMLVAVLLGYGVLPGPTEPAASPGSETEAVALHVTKEGDDVVFVLQNGGTAHTVTRLISPENGGESMDVVRGSFRDDLHDGPDLVFYRID